VPVSEFAEKVVLVTGGTTGIGYATAKAFAGEGSRVVICGCTREKGDKALEELGHLGSDVRFVQADVTSESSVKEMVEFAIDSFGALDYAFNNAGIFVPEPLLHEHPTGTWEKVIASNLTGVYLCMKYELAAMLRTQRKSDGVIINNASIVGHRGSRASGLAYTAAKHGVLGLTKQAAINYAGQGVRVNAVSPGPTLTEATRSGLEGPADEVEARISLLNPTGELVPTEGIAAAVTFLCSSGASMINGHDVPLDGGQLAKL